MAEMNREETHRPSPARIMELANAFYGSGVLFAASDAGVFGVLSHTPGADVDCICSECKLNRRAGRLLLDGCVAIGLLEKSVDGGYRNTPESEAFLVSGRPGGLCEAIRYNRDVYDAWGKLPTFLETGEPVEPPSLHLGDDAARTRDFVLAMHERALSIGRGVIPNIDLAGCASLLDVGGGSGAYAMLMAQASEQLHVTVVDLPAVAAIARELTAEAGMSDRVDFIGGSYLDTPFPEDFDAVHFFGVLHQESAETIPGLLKRAFDALKPGGVVRVMDMMTDGTRAAPPFSALFALNMALTKEDGWVFSDQDMREWLTEAGFVDVSVSPLPAPMPHWVISASRPL